MGIIEGLERPLSRENTRVRGKERDSHARTNLGREEISWVAASFRPIFPKPVKETSEIFPKSFEVDKVKEHVVARGKYSAYCSTHAGTWWEEWYLR